MWREFDSGYDSVQAMLQDISAVLKQQVSESGHATLAVSGGRSPIPLFQALACTALPWPKITLSLVDDRFVPADHADSNEKLVRTYLLQHQAASAHFLGLVSDPNDIAASVAHANTLPGEITVAILGMGDDGHTASLFPDAPQLADALAPEQSQRYLQMTPGQAAHERISLTLAALLRSKHIMLAIAGEHKRAVLQEAAKETTPALPISYVINQTGVPIDVYWHS